MSKKVVTITITPKIDTICTSNTKKGTKCTNKAINDGLCRLHTVKDNVIVSKNKSVTKYSDNKLCSIKDCLEHTSDISGICYRHR